MDQVGGWGSGGVGYGPEAQPYDVFTETPVVNKVSDSRTGLLGKIKKFWNRRQPTSSPNLPETPIDSMRNDSTLSMFGDDSEIGYLPVFPADSTSSTSSDFEKEYYLQSGGPVDETLYSRVSGGGSVGSFKTPMVPIEVTDASREQKEDFFTKKLNEMKQDVKIQSSAVVDAIEDCKRELLEKLHDTDERQSDNESRQILSKRPLSAFQRTYIQRVFKEARSGRFRTEIEEKLTLPELRQKSDDGLGGQ